MKGGGAVTEWREGKGVMEGGGQGMGSGVMEVGGSGRE